MGGSRTEEISCCKKYIWYIITISFCMVLGIGILIQYFYEFSFLGNSSKIAKNKDIDKNELLKTNKKNVIETEFKAIIGIDLGSKTSGYYIIKEPFEDLGNIDIKELMDSEIIIYKLSETGLCIGHECDYTVFGLDPYNKIHLYFTSFKRNLDPKINKSMIASDPPGDEIEIKVVIK